MFAILIPVKPGTDHRTVINLLEFCLGQLTSEDQLVVVAEQQIFCAIRNSIGASSTQITLVEHPKTKTAGAARNAGLDQVSKSNVIFLDVDDFPDELHIDEIKKLLMSGYSIVCGALRLSHNKLIKRPYGNNDTFYFRTNIFLPSSGYAFKRFNAVRFPENLHIGEDTVFFSRLLSKGASVFRSQHVGVSYTIDSAKIKSKSGLLGVQRELKFRIELLKSTRTLKQKFYVVLGLFVFIVAKISPFSDRLYFSKLLNRYED